MAVKTTFGTKLSTDSVNSVFGASHLPVKVTASTDTHLFEWPA
jgi:hypothetical protein